MLHHLARSLHCVVPGLEDVGESLAVLGHPAEYLEGDLGEDAEGALGAHHDLVEVGAAGLAGVVAGLNGADGGGVLLAEDDVRDAAVVGAVLTGAAGDGPAADRGVFKALREVAAGVLTLCAEELRSVLEGLFEVGTGHTRLNGDGLVDLVEGKDLVKALSHIQRDAALDGLDAAGDGAAAAVNVQGDVMLGGIRNDLLDLLGRVGIEHDIGNGVDDLMAQAEDIIGREAVSNGKTVVVGDREALLADDFLESVEMLLSELNGVVGQVYLIEADVVRVLFEVIVGELEDFLHHLVQRLLGELEEFGIAPAENRTVAALRSGSVHPFGLEALVIFMAHQIMFLSLRLFIVA